MKKSIGKKVVFTGFSIFLTYLTFNLAVSLLQTTDYNFNLGESILIACLINLYATGIFAMLGFVFPTNKFLPKTYYKIKNAKLLTTVYNSLGVSYFRVLLLLAFWGSKKNRKKYFDGTRKGLYNFIYQSKQSEFGHLAAFISITFLCGILVYKGLWEMLAFTVVINFIGNFYPIILQRYHRIRISKLM